MNKCTNCGTEFDGNFCPECGQKREGEITCPQCGNKVANNANFCLMCGHRIAQQPEHGNEVKTKQKDKSLDTAALAARVFGLLRYVPMALTLLFAVLLPLLYIAPIVQADQMMGAAESINVYSLDEDFYGVSVAYLVFMCIAILLSAVLLYLHINKEKRQKYIRLFGKVRISVGELAALFAVVLVYLPCLIISAVAMGKAAELNELLGGGLADVIFAGAAPKAVLSFAVIFTVFSIGAVIARIFIGKAYPELLPKEPEVIPCKKPMLYYAFLNVKFRRAATAFFVCSYLTAVAYLGFFMVSGERMMMKLQWIILVGIVITVVCVIACMSFAVYDWSPDEFLFKVQTKKCYNECKPDVKLGLKKIVLYILPLAAMIFIYWFMSVDNILLLYGRGFIIATVHITLCAILYIIAKVVIAKQSKAIIKYLYSVAEMKSNGTIDVKLDSKNELAAYEAYQKAKKYGVVIADDDKTKRAIFIRRLVLSLVCCVFVAMSIVTTVVPFFL